MNELINSKSYFLNPNHVVISKENEVNLYSYNTFIASYNKEEEKLYLNSSKWDYSNTTRKYFKAFIEDFTPFNYDTKQKFIRTIELSEDIITFNKEGMIVCKENISFCG